jgi:hypothetical protein
MHSQASDDFDHSEGDFQAPPAQPGSGEEAYLLAPFGEKLGTDYRGIADTVLWKLAVAVPAGAKATWTLAWDSATLPDGYACTLTPADALWDADGDAVDMTTTTSQTVVNGGATLTVFRFLVAIAHKQSVELALTPGWNLVGVPLTLDDASRYLILDEPRILGFYQYSAATGYTVPTDFAPGSGYWIYANATFTLTLAGLPSSGGIPLDYGWNLVAPCTDSPNPLEAHGVIAVWAWDPELGYYLPSLADPAAVLSTMGIWVFATEETVIWDDAP